jgi:threonine dehydrogenase-like Zn-dependent dehydrogenase
MAQLSEYSPHLKRGETGVEIPFHRAAKLDPDNLMLAAEWRAPERMKLVHRPRPLVTDATDVIVRVTSTAICGSDLHMFFGEIPGMKRGDVLGHEFMGTVDAVGSAVQNFKVGDRVVTSAVIACGQCFYCKKGLYSCCEATNPSSKMDTIYGHRTAGIFGYTHLTGGFDGGQAEYARVPLGDVNCLKVPEGIPDEKVLLLSDVACTGWQATVYLGHVKEGDTVAVWGCGPVGLMCMAWAKWRGAGKVIAIEREGYRISFAKEHLGVLAVNADKENVLDSLKVLCPRGPDVCIDATGFRFTKSFASKFQRFTGLEGDTVESLDEAIKAARKGGRIVQIADYFSTTNNFPTGAIQLKALKFLGGQVHVQRFWHDLLDLIVRGKFDPSFIITHHMPLEKVAEAYKMFGHHENNCVKIMLHTPYFYELNRPVSAHMQCLKPHQLQKAKEKKQKKLLQQQQQTQQLPQQLWWLLWLPIRLLLELVW